MSWRCVDHEQCMSMYEPIVVFLFMEVGTAVTLAVYFNQSTSEIYFNSWAVRLNEYELCPD